MSQWLDLLRGPALGVIAMILLIAMVIVITAFAALIAQVALLLRLRPWNSTEKKDGSSGTESYSQDRRGSYAVVRENRQNYMRNRREPQAFVVDPESGDVIDADWWEVAK